MADAQEVQKLSHGKDQMAEMMGNERIQKVGKRIVEHLAEGSPTKSSHGRKLQEKLEDMGINSKEDLHRIADNSEGVQRATEDLQFGNNTVLYTTAVTSFVEKELRSELVSADVIKDLQLPSGADDIDVVKGSNRDAATAVSSDGSVTLESSDYGSKNIQTDLYGSREVVTLELMQVTTIDVMADLLEELGRSIALKMDDTIQSEFQDATDPTGTYGDNSNYNYLGSGTTITYDNLVAGIHSAKENNANPTDIVAGPGIMSSLEQDDEFSDAAQFASSPENFVPQTMRFRDLMVHESSNVATDSLFIVDRNQTGYFVEGGPVETFDARVNDKAAFEILALKRFGTGLARPAAIYGIHQDEATPT